MKIKAAIQLALSQLNACDNPGLEAGYLLSAVLKKDRAYVYSHFEEDLGEPHLTQFHDWLQKRASGMPLAYLTGEKYFWDLNLKVNEHTLIPRPETELLIETALNYLPKNENLQVADLGTGSGAIALAIKRMRPNWDVTAVDSSEGALQVAQTNATNLSLPITFYQSNWTAKLADLSQDALISNPPYIPENDPHLSSEIAFEPRSALVAGADGLDAYRAILKDAARVLRPKGYLFFEHGYDQLNALAALIHQHNFFIVESLEDQQHHPRVLVAQK